MKISVDELLDKSKEELVKMIMTHSEIIENSTKVNEQLRAIASENMEKTKVFTDMAKKVEKIPKLKNENLRLDSKIAYLTEENKKQSKLIQKLDNENERLLQEIAKLKKVPYVKHPGGRPTIFDEQTVAEIKAYRKNTRASYKDIALKYNCSVGTIHKLINENKRK